MAERITTRQSSRRSVKSAAKPAKPIESAGRAPDPRPPRRLRPLQYRSLKFTKRIHHPVVLLSSWKLTKQARLLVWRNWKVVGGIVLIYGVLNLLLVQGLSKGIDLSAIKSEFNSVFTGFFANALFGLGAVTLLAGSVASKSGNANATVYQSILVFLISLALIWTYRQIVAGKRVSVKDAFYRGMYPLIPMLLVLVVITLQLIPVIAGGWLLTTVIQNGIAITFLERFLWVIIFLLTALLSIYMITSSVFALYIVTLVDMTPFKALRSARELVRFRRWVIMRKVLYLPFWLFMVGWILMLPVIFLIPAAAQWIFLALTLVGLAIGHAYMYLLYRELLREKN